MFENHDHLIVRTLPQPTCEKLSPTNRERNKRIRLHKLSLVVQKVFRIEFMRELPVILVHQHRGEVGDYCSSLLEDRFFYLVKMDSHGML